MTKVASPEVVAIHVAKATRLPMRAVEEVEAPDIETAAALGDGIVVAMRGVAYRPGR